MQSDLGRNSHTYDSLNKQFAQQANEQNGFNGIMFFSQYYSNQSNKGFSGY